MLLQSLLIQNRKSLRVFDFIQSRFLYLERSLTFLGRLQIVEIGCILLENATLAHDFEIFAVELRCVLLESLLLCVNLRPPGCISSCLRSLHQLRRCCLFLVLICIEFIDIVFPVTLSFAHFRRCYSEELSLISLPICF